MALKALQAENELLKHFRKELARASEFYLGMALVTKGGLKLILARLSGALKGEDVDACFSALICRPIQTRFGA